MQFTDAANARTADDLACLGKKLDGVVTNIPLSQSQQLQARFPYECPLLTQSGHGYSGLLPCKLIPVPHFADRKSLL
jgi:hypothetical protein